MLDNITKNWQQFLLTIVSIYSLWDLIPRSSTLVGDSLKENKNVKAEVYVLNHYFRSVFGDQNFDNSEFSWNADDLTEDYSISELLY